MPPIPKTQRSPSARGPPTAANGERLLPIEEVSTRTSLSRAEIYRRIKLGEFPAPIRLSGAAGMRGGRVAFIASEIDAWITARIAEWREANP
jgi:predicted DNA-binding transcriptional regulator AlpA